MQDFIRRECCVCRKFLGNKPSVIPQPDDAVTSGYCKLHLREAEIKVRSSVLLEEQEEYLAGGAIQSQLFVTDIAPASGEKTAVA